MGCFWFSQGIRRKTKRGKRVLTKWARDCFGSSKVDSPSSRSEEDSTEPQLNDIVRFSLAELKVATRNFGEKIGEGSFGAVYKGLCKLKVGKSEEMVPVAVKKLNIKGVQGQKEWLSEITLLRMVDHPNVVKLIGYCIEDDERGPESLLVYEYMPNKSLDYHIFERSGSLLPWKQRLQIAIGTARGLAYLHEEMKPQIIFRDLKAANILLDDEFQPKLSDFGLARRGPNVGDTHVTTAVVGTPGYAAPDYVQTGHLTAKSDVWSFGMVLLELVTGRKAVDWNRPRNERNLGEWAKPFMKDSKQFQRIIDNRLKKDYPPDEARRLLSLVQKCTAQYPKRRPNMSEVVQMLLQNIESPARGSMMRTIDEEARSASYRGSSVSGSVDLSGYFSSKEAEGNSRSRREQVNEFSSVKSSNSRSEPSGAGRDQLVDEQKEDGPSRRNKSSGSDLGVVTNCTIREDHQEDAGKRSSACLEMVREDNREDSVPFEDAHESEPTRSDSNLSLQEDARSAGNLNLKEDGREEKIGSEIKSSLDEDTKSKCSAGLEAQENLSLVSSSKSSRQEDAQEELLGTKNESAESNAQQLAQEELLSMEAEDKAKKFQEEEEVSHASQERNKRDEATKNDPAGLVEGDEEKVSGLSSLQQLPHSASERHLKEDVRHSSADDMHRQGQEEETRRHRQKQDEADPQRQKESEHAGTV